MKRRSFQKHLKEHNCFLLREGGGHSIFKNADNGKLLDATKT